MATCAWTCIARRGVETSQKLGGSPSAMNEGSTVITSCLNRLLDHLPTRIGRTVLKGALSRCGSPLRKDVGCHKAQMSAYPGVPGEIEGPQTTYLCH
jgi:hypothetical protein